MNLFASFARRAATPFARSLARPSTHFSFNPFPCPSINRPSFMIPHRSFSTQTPAPPSASQGATPETNEEEGEEEGDEDYEDDEEFEMDEDEEEGEEDEDEVEEVVEGLAEGEKISWAHPIELSTKTGKISTEVFQKVAINAIDDPEVFAHVHADLADLSALIEDNNDEEEPRPTAKIVRVIEEMNDVVPIFHPATGQILQYLRREDALDSIPEILKGYVELFVAFLRKEQVTVTAAHESDIPTEAQIREKLGLSDVAELEITVEVDKSIGDGVIMKSASGAEYSSTYKGTLEQLREAIQRVIEDREAKKETKIRALLIGEEN